MDGNSLDITSQKIQELKALFPEVFTEGKIDFDRLKTALGEDVLKKGEHYELSWAGKTEARKEVQKQTTATLIPDREGSIGFDNAQNIFIEGENLEVLRTLQKAYFGKIKMIYIDPPYNTGSDSFVYPDDYSERKNEYNRRTGITDEAGFLNKQDLWKKNTKESGQYHSAWLSMMYPRLFLARNLLKDDGVIFVSIDDNEQGNLELLLNDVFGEENKIGKIIWKNATDNNPTQIAMEHEYVLVYSKSKKSVDSEWKSSVSDVKELLIKVGDELTRKHSELGPLQAEYQFWFKEHKDQLWPLDRYKNIDFEGVYTGSQSVHNPGKEGYRYDVNHPVTKKPTKQPLMGYRFHRDTMNLLIEEGKIIFGEDENKIIELKVYAKDFADKLSSLIELDGRVGAYDLKEVFPQSTRLFNNPKPVRFLSQFFPFVLKSDDIVLDFFGGSATTAHVIFELNRKDSGSRKFICVQFPEPLDENSEGKRAGYNTIADISKARIKKVIEKLELGRKEKLDFDADTKQQLGFRAYKLAPSNFKVWRTDVDKEQILAQLEIFTQAEKQGSEHENMLHELILKAGKPLTATVDKKIIEDAEVYHVNNGELFLFFDKLNAGITSEILSTKPTKVISLNSCFEKDEDLTNFKLQLKDAGIDLTIV